MQLNVLASFEDLLATVDLLCIPLSKDMLEPVHRDVLSLLIPATILPPVSELNTQNHSVSLYYGQWNGRRIKLLLSYEGDKLTESTAYIVSKRLSMRSKNENGSKTGFMTHHISDPDIILSADLMNASVMNE